MNSLWQDLRYASRMLIKKPGYAIVAVLTLGLGIGINTAIFSLMYAILLHPLPYGEGNNLVVFRQMAPLAGVDNMPFSAKDLLDYREQNSTLDEVVEYHSMPFILLGGTEPERVQTGVVSANFFSVFGVNPILGRTFLPDEDQPGAEPVLVLSYRYWQLSHGGDPEVVGRTFEMNNKVHTVIGVLPPLPDYPDANDVFMPVSGCPFRSDQAFIANRGARMMTAFGKLKPGVSLQMAQADISTVAGNLVTTYPESYTVNGGYTTVLTPMQEELTKRAKPTLLILLGTAGLVLLIACTNVANLTFARLMDREREMAIRSALGAGRGRLVRQLLTESSLLAILGGALGLALAAGGMHLLVSFASKFTSRASEISLDASVLLFTLIISVLTGLASGLVPALSTERNLLSSLKEGGNRSTTGGKQQVRALLIVVQVAVSFILLVGAGLMVRSLINLQQIDPGFKPASVLTLRTDLNWTKYSNRDQIRSFYKTLLERTTSHPGVQMAAVSVSFPLNQTEPTSFNFMIEGRPLAQGEAQPVADIFMASSDYFQTIGMPLITGRGFAETDDEKAPGVVIINQAMARHRWSGEDPIGQRISLNRGRTWLQIIGVVGDVRQYELNRAPQDEMYRPFIQSPAGDSRIVVRTAADPMILARQIEELVHQIDPQQPVTDILTLEQVRHESLSTPRLTAILLTLFAVLALVITAAGISGIMALTVSHRTHEIGIRMALGAAKRDVLGMLMKQSTGLVMVGLLLGIGGAIVLTRLMTAVLFGVVPTDLLTFLGATLLLIIVAAVSCFLPARRVTSIDPMIALRAE
jgi:predicted permease